MANKLIVKKQKREKRKQSVRTKISGTEIKPRITVFKSNKFFYAQAIDDIAGKTVASARSIGFKVEDIKKLGKDFGAKLKKAGIETGVFDRNGYKYTGKVANFADGIREAGLNM